MDNSPNENVTLRRPKRTSSLNDVTFLTHNSTLFDPNATVISLPNTSIDENQDIKELKNKILILEEKLQSANQEIENLNLENRRLTKDLEKRDKTINLYKQLGLTDANCKTPSSLKKMKARKQTNCILDTSLQASAECTTPSSSENVCTTPTTSTNVSRRQDQTTKKLNKTNIPVKSFSELRDCSAPFAIDKNKSGKNIHIEIKNNKKQIIILADQQGCYIRESLANIVGSDYNVTTILKPGARLQQITQTHREELRNLDKNDYIILLGGTNDINPREFQTQFRNFLSTYKNTNIITCEISYNRILRVDLLNNYLKFTCNKNNHACYIDMNYSRYIPKGRFFSIYSARHILRELIRLDYSSKLLQNYFNQTSNISKSPNKYTTDRSTQTYSDQNQDINVAKNTPSPVSNKNKTIKEKLFRV